MIEAGKTSCIACKRSLRQGHGIGLIGNGGVVCKVCYLAAPEVARRAAGNNPDQVSQPEPARAEEGSLEGVRST